MRFDVITSAGTLRDPTGTGWTIPHAWTTDGVLVQADGTGAHALLLSVALCVLNDTFREAEALGLSVSGVRVRADSDFDTERWVSSGISYAVEIDAAIGPGDVATLLAKVDAVAEIPRVLRAGLTVERTDG
jgi:hypothetical protein